MMLQMLSIRGFDVADRLQYATTRSCPEDGEPTVDPPSGYRECGPWMYIESLGESHTRWVRPLVEDREAIERAKRGERFEATLIEARSLARTRRGRARRHRPPGRRRRPHRRGSGPRRPRQARRHRGPPRRRLRASRAPGGLPPAQRRVDGAEQHAIDDAGHAAARLLGGAIAAVEGGGDRRPPPTGGPPRAP